MFSYLAPFNAPWSNGKSPTKTIVRSAPTKVFAMVIWAASRTPARLDTLTCYRPRQKRLTQSSCSTRQKIGKLMIYVVLESYY